MGDLFQRIEDMTGQKVIDTVPRKGGYTPAIRLQVELNDGSTIFAKAGTNEMTVIELRKESRFYRVVKGDFIPEFIDYQEDEDQPILLIEDLSQAYWPPPWSENHISIMLQAVQKIWQTPPPEGLPLLSDWTKVLDGWQRVEKDPSPFLSLGIVSSDWLKKVLPLLTAIDGPELAKGEKLIHMDLRSDNMCFKGNRGIIIDWNMCCIGNSEFDLAFWIPSLLAEGATLPDYKISPDIAAIVTGFFASRAGLPNILSAPQVRNIQQIQLEAALPWLVELLDLPELTT